MRRYRYVRPKGRQHRERGNGIYQCGVFSGYFKFIGKSGSQQLGRGGVLVGIVTHESESSPQFFGRRVLGSNQRSAMMPFMDGVVPV